MPHRIPANRFCYALSVLGFCLGIVPWALPKAVLLRPLRGKELALMQVLTALEALEGGERGFILALLLRALAA